MTCLVIRWADCWWRKYFPRSWISRCRQIVISWQTPLRPCRNASAYLQKEVDISAHHLSPALSVARRGLSLLFKELLLSFAMLGTLAEWRASAVTVKLPSLSCSCDFCIFLVRWLKSGKAACCLTGSNRLCSSTLLHGFFAEIGDLRWEVRRRSKAFLYIVHVSDASRQALDSATEGKSWFCEYQRSWNWFNLS